MILRSLLAQLPLAAHQLRARHHHEGAQRRHDEYVGPQRADAVLLRRQGQRTSAPRMYCASACSSLRCSRMLSVYGYQAYSHYHDGQKPVHPQPRARAFHRGKHPAHPARRMANTTELEARILDLALVLHAEHGGGNNSTFTTHVVTSSGTDTYSAVAASLASPEGPEARRRQHQGSPDVRRHEAECQGLDGRRGGRAPICARCCTGRPSTKRA